MEYIKLSNGVEIPTLGYGVFLINLDERERNGLPEQESQRIATNFIR